MNKAKFLMVLLAVCVIFGFPLMLTPDSIDAAPAASTAGRVTTASGPLNVRASASASSAIVTVLAKGSYVTLMSKSGSWWYVEYAGGKYGYCSDQYITQVSGSYGAYVNTASGNLNVRDGAGAGFEVIDKISKGTAVVVMQRVGDWYWILYDGTNIGYCSASYITAYSKQKYPAISLTAADYKQTDSRWASVTLGSSGRTISKSGCLTCCVAIIETYRKGYTIYPHTMSYSSSYTSDGSLYWPGYFSFYNSYVDYLSVLYNSLEKGRPAIIGLKKPDGSQHWVVVTGYTGGDSLYASGFKISDPGSNTRKNLQQLIDVYPNFHRIAYY